MVLLLATVMIGLWLAVVGVTAGLLVGLARVLEAIDLVDDEGGDDRGDGGHGRPHGPEPPLGGGEPDWWPEFESELADYLASRG